METLQTLFYDIFAKGELVRMIFSGKRKKSLACAKVTIRPVKLSGKTCFQAEYTFEKKVTHENLSAEEAAALALRLTQEAFKQINIFTLSEDVQVLASKPEKPRITTKPATKDMPTLEHNREKKRLIPEKTPCDFLARLGVMDQDGNVIQKHYSKYRQINRYLEIVEDVFPALPKDRPLRIIDFGCVKAYLTFALYYYLKVLKGRLRFLRGDIADYTSDYADMVVTLHACDTATDYALINAVSWNTRVILSVPCCQHELFSQIKSEVHQPMLKHGILKDRLTEYLTDGLRGLKLEACGYDVAMIEFTSLEHTARNIMIKAVKTGNAGSVKAKKAQQQYEALRDFYHVSPTIDRL